MSETNTSCGTEWLVINQGGELGVGNVKNKKGFQKVKINIRYLKDAIKLLNMQPIDINVVTLYVKTDKPIQIGTKEIGILIAPIVTEKESE